MKNFYYKSYTLIYSLIIMQCVLFASNLNAQTTKLGTVNNSELEKTSSNKSTIIRRTTSSGFQKIRIEFLGLEGASIRRELLLGFSDATTDGYDYGYDAAVMRTYDDDLNLDLNGTNMSIQAYCALSEDKVIKFNHYSSGENTFSIKVIELENIEEGQSIYIQDAYTGKLFDLASGEAYEFVSSQGAFTDRFQMAFQEETSVLSSTEVAYNSKNMFYQNSTNTFYAKSLKNGVKKLVLFNLQGQKVLEYSNLSSSELNSGINFNSIPVNAYAVVLQTETNEIVKKKIIVN
ncbi:hypothetical protein [Neotamlana laminarinivorans]|uniref:Secreted protein (Por secretion system target) n=1 Tax=Neotamlana laminarinivorans TaxID=2883124 RepID=A0A9X1HYM6_9FLAO|nr:hypothetical protein [Tamlana laminarinivorans]MCB4797991.1 hypothetical protein [Tamlana laminarinivorans]